MIFGSGFPLGKIRSLATIERKRVIMLLSFLIENQFQNL